MKLLPDDLPNVMGFSPSVNQRLLPPTFPRYTKIKDRMETLNYLEELSHNLKLACKVINCTNYQSTLNFFMEFSKKSGPCLLSRSVLQVIYLPDNNKVFGVTSLTDVLKESVKSFIAPPVLMPKNPLFNNAQVSCSFAGGVSKGFPRFSAIFRRPKNASTHFSSTTSTSS
jgi:N-alpha-acetyltransferase 35, NatC auxiliary subunit